MDISIFLARFWGSLFLILGLSFVGAKLLGRVIQYTENKTITVSTGYTTFLLGLVTVVAHNLWVADWRVAVTILGWVTLLKGIEKIAFPDRVNKKAQMFKRRQTFWGFIILLIGAVYFWMSFK
jgi:glucose uptake protein GlcU